MESLFHEESVSSNRIIYTPSLFARENLIFLQETGTLQALTPHICHREHLSSYLFFIVLSGTGTLEYDGFTYELEIGDCIFINCQKSYSHYSSNNLWKLQWVHFYGANTNGIYEKYVQRGGQPIFHPSSLDSFSILLQQLYDISISDDYIRDMRLFEKLVTLLTLLMEESWNPDHAIARGKQQNTHMQQIKDYLNTNYQKKITLDALAEQFFINKFYLTRVFKEQYGISINNYIIQLRITHAKQLLRFSDLPIEKISDDCGISDANYFSRMFKKVEGVTPGEYRRLWEH